MKREKLVSHHDERLDQDTINMLFHSVFPHLSDMVIFNLAHFCQLRKTPADDQFQEALGLEAFRRGLVTKPDFSIVNVNLDKFAEDDLDTAATWFDDGPNGPTVEDVYAEYVLDHDRWTERYNPKEKKVKIGG